MFVPIYDNTTGQFLGVKETLGYIMVRNEPEESFLTYGHSAEHSAILFCYSKAAYAKYISWYGLQ